MNVAIETQKQIVLLLANGFTAKEIGEKMKLSNRTIEKYLDVIKGELNAKTSAHLVHICHQNKMIK
jgi:DNA-binding NarL/FixJ family response regulator